MSDLGTVLQEIFAVAAEALSGRQPDSCGCMQPFSKLNKTAPRILEEATHCFAGSVVAS